MTSTARTTVTALLLGLLTAFAAVASHPVDAAAAVVAQRQAAPPAPQAAPLGVDLMAFHAEHLRSGAMGPVVSLTPSRTPSLGADVASMASPVGSSAALGTAPEGTDAGASDAAWLLCLIDGAALRA